LFCCLLLFSQAAFAGDSLMLQRISDHILLEGACYENLRDLCKNIGHRISGSPQAEQAVTWAERLMKEAGADTVWLQPVEVPKWVRGAEKLQLRLGGNGKMTEVPVLSIGNSVGTGGKILEAQVLMVADEAAFHQLLPEQVKGRIVFFNYRFRQDLVNTFDAYGDAVKYRWQAPDWASSKGAIAVIIRSVSTGLGDVPHTGTLRYADSLKAIPAVTIGNSTADMLEAACKNGIARARLQSHCRMEGTARSYNVIGEIRGSSFPGEIIVAGGHLDSWDVGEGAHDDGAGCVQAIEMLRTFRALDIKPKRTVRAVLFMNEENGLKGGTAYADSAEARKEHHIFALESDAGGFSPRGIGLVMDDEKKQKIRTFAPLFFHYGVYDFQQESGGADISPLKKQGVPVAGLIPDSQRYFELHHTDRDVFEAVNHRELKLGAVAMAGLVYLVSEYGL